MSMCVVDVEVPLHVFTSDLTLVFRNPLTFCPKGRLKSTFMDLDELAANWFKYKSPLKK